MKPIVENLVSTIIPVFNRPAMLRRAVESTVAQTWRPIEVLISDDGSTDDTPALGQQLEADHPGIIHYQWNPNRGPGPARESGRQIARGEFIQYLDSDDTLWPRKFEVQVQALRTRRECGAAYGFIRLCPEGSAPAEKPHKWTGKELPSLFPWLLVDRWWNTNAPLWRRTVCDAIGPWSDLRYSQDWEYDARAGALGTKLVHCPEFVCDQHIHESIRQTGHGNWLSPPERARFFKLLLRHAIAAGVALESPEMRHFSRWVFAHARECGVAGDADSARGCLGIAQAAASGLALDMKAYRVVAAVLGWSTLASVSTGLHSLAGGQPGRHTLKQSWMEP